jgi:hypothetical protein
MLPFPVPQTLYNRAKLTRGTPSLVAAWTAFAAAAAVAAAPQHLYSSPAAIKLLWPLFVNGAHLPPHPLLLLLSVLLLLLYDHSSSNRKARQSVAAAASSSNRRHSNSSSAFTQPPRLQHILMERLCNSIITVTAHHCICNTVG